MQKNCKVGLAIAVASFLPLVVFAQRQTPVTEQELVAVDGQDPAPSTADRVALLQVLAVDRTHATRSEARPPDRPSSRAWREPTRR
jgi:hypothetical protein